MQDKTLPSSEDRNSTRELHNSLSRICKNLPTDFQPWGERDRDAGTLSKKKSFGMKKPESKNRTAFPLGRITILDILNL
jgi:hypothetical protein